MLDILPPLLPDGALERLVTFDLDASAVPAGALLPTPDLAFVDGEHTVAAAFSDVVHLLPMLSPNAVIVFHDWNLVLGAIRNAETMLRHAGRMVAAAFLPDTVAVLGLGALAATVEAELVPHALPREEAARRSEARLRRAMVDAAIAAGEIPPRPPKSR